MRLELAVKWSTADCLQVADPIGHLPKESKARAILSDPTPIRQATKAGGIKALAMNCRITEGDIHHYLKAGTLGIPRNV